MKRNGRENSGLASCHFILELRLSPRRKIYPVSDGEKEKKKPKKKTRRIKKNKNSKAWQYGCCPGISQSISSFAIVPLGRGGESFVAYITLREKRTGEGSEETLTQFRSSGGHLLPWPHHPSCSFFFLFRALFISLSLPHSQAN